MHLAVQLTCEYLTCRRSHLSGPWRTIQVTASALAEGVRLQDLDAGRPGGEGGCGGVTELGRRPQVDDGHRHRLGAVENGFVTIGRPRPLGEPDGVDGDSVGGVAS